MRVTSLVLIQILSKRMWVDWPKCRSDPPDEGHLACLDHEHYKSFFLINHAYQPYIFKIKHTYVTCMHNDPLPFELGIISLGALFL